MDRGSVTAGPWLTTQRGRGLLRHHALRDIRDAQGGQTGT
jgi:hypothetical protein